MLDRLEFIGLGVCDIARAAVCQRLMMLDTVNVHGHDGLDHLLVEASGRLAHGANEAAGLDKLNDRDQVGSLNRERAVRRERPGPGDSTRLLLSQSIS